MNIRLKLLNRVNQFEAQGKEETHRLESRQIQQVVPQIAEDILCYETSQSHGWHSILNWNGTDENDVTAITCGEGKDASQRTLYQFVDNVLHGASQPDKEGRSCWQQLPKKALAASAREHRVELHRYRWQNVHFRHAMETSFDRDQEWRTSWHPRAKIRSGLESRLVALGTARLASSLPDPYSLAVEAAVNYSSVYTRRCPSKPLVE